MIDLRSQKSYDCNDLRKIVHILRSPGGCQWDQAQTHQSIRRNFLEEAYEVAEAIDEGDLDHLKEELGDVLLQVVFHSSIEEDAGRFDLDDVADGVCRKLIYRHPHVFGDVSVQSTDEILSNWEDLKKKEKGQATQADAVDAVDKLSEEVDELRSALSGQGNPVEELGDLFFAAVCVSRFLNADPDDVLQAASDKFAARFRRVEALAGQQGRPMNEMTLEELKALWVQAKTQA